MVSNAYSITSLYELEPAVQASTDRFIERMGEFAASGNPVDFSSWLQWYAFDTIGAITFSSRFGFLDRGEDIDNTLQTIEGALWGGIVLAELPLLDRLQKHPITRALLPFIGAYENKRNHIAKVGPRLV
jgi:hypothetical protein